MAITVTFTEDPAEVMASERDFLASQPVLHNLILTLLNARIARSEPGRYWVAKRGDCSVGVVLQSPLTMAATLTPMQPDAVARMVDAIVDQGVSLPGINGDAATAACFAGQWTERCKSAAIPFQGQRLYEVVEVTPQPGIAGKLRNAVARDRDLAIAWTRGFQDSVGDHGTAAETYVDRWLSSGQLFFWDDGEPKSMAANREPVAGVVRVQGVYTPPNQRGRGYAAACVGDLSQRIRSSGYRCILHTDLGNTTSNSIYRRIGYRAVAEALRYRFE